MSLEIINEDPLKILSSTKFVVEKAQEVEIDESKIQSLLKPIKEMIKTGLEEAVASAGSLRDFEKDCQLVFTEDCVNFCFWAEKDKEKWQVEYPKGNLINGGWYGLEACFRRAVEEKTPILTAQYLTRLSEKKVTEIFRSSNGVEIPLIEERQKNLQEAGRVLLQKYDGEFINLLEESAYSAAEIIKNVVGNFSSFNDVSKYQGQEVFFFKRAQIVANDSDFVCRKYGKKIKDLDKLTAMADYRLPQILRNFGVIVYSPNLAQKVDNYILIKKDSFEEVEIRASTIWAVELIRQNMPQFLASQIDNALWLISQNFKDTAKPHHRTYTIYY